MRQSQYFLKTKRQAPGDETSINAKILEQAGYIDKLMAGVYTYLPLGLRVLKKIEAIIRQEMNAIGGQELFMPALHPLANYERTKRDKIEVLFHLDQQTAKNIVLGQSHEEIIVPLVKKFIHSYHDLPLYLYQIQTKFRNELRAKSGILRSREFMMKDLYSFHSTAEDLDIYYEIAKSAYHKIFQTAGLGEITYLTYASGGTFSQYSHEFQTVTPAGEDTIYLCDSCRIAVNREIIDKQKTCPKCGNSKLTEKKSIEVGNIFPLKTKFSEAFDLNFTDQQGQKKIVYMGCYGIGLGRLMGAIVETHHDQAGIIWPAQVSPFTVHLLRLGDDETTKKQAETIYQHLQKEKVDILYDDREESAGVKLKDADMIGIAVRLISSAKTKDKVEFKLRQEPAASQMTIASAIKEITKIYHRENI